MYTVVTREKMTTEWDGSKRITLKYRPSGVDKDIENGMVVLVKDLVKGEREVYTAETPKKDTALSDLALVTTPEVMVDERVKSISDFVNKSGDICTGDKLFKGDIFSLTAEGFDGDPAEGKIVEVQDGVKLKVVATATAGSTTIGKIIDVVNGKYAVQVG